MFFGVVILSKLFADIRSLTACDLLLIGWGDHVDLRLVDRCTVAIVAWHDQCSIVVGRWLDHGGHAWRTTYQADLCGECSHCEQDVHVVCVEHLTEVSIHFIDLYNLRA